MTYFVTGASGFIGKRLVRKLLAPQEQHGLLSDPRREQKKSTALLAFWGEDAPNAASRWSVIWPNPLPRRAPQ